MERRILFLFTFQQNEELKRQLTAQNKLIEKHKENIDKCLDLTKKLLVEKVSKFILSVQMSILRIGGQNVCFTL